MQYTYTFRAGILADIWFQNILVHIKLEKYVAVPFSISCTYYLCYLNELIELVSSTIILNVNVHVK